MGCFVICLYDAWGHNCESKIKAMKILSYEMRIMSLFYLSFHITNYNVVYLLWKRMKIYEYSVPLCEELSNK